MSQRRESSPVQQSKLTLFPLTALGAGGERGESSFLSVWEGLAGGH